LLAGTYKCRTIRASDHILQRPAAKPQPTTPTIHVEGTFEKGRPQPVAKSSAVPEGKRMAVQFSDGRRILILRVDGTVNAFAARCPHAGYRMEDGWYDNRWMACPGHGLEFDTRTGESKADCFRLAKYDVSESNGMIFLG